MSKIINISVADKIATASKRGPKIVCGNSDYVVKFTFDDEWDGYVKKYARFIFNDIKRDVEFVGDECPMPKLEKTTSVEIGVWVGELATTTPAKLECELSILCKDVKEPDPEYSKVNTSDIANGAITEEKLAPALSNEIKDARLKAGAADINATIAKNAAAEALAVAKRAEQATVHNTESVMRSFIARQKLSDEELTVQEQEVTEDIKLVYSVDYEEYSGASSIEPDVFAWFSESGANVTAPAPRRIGNRIYTCLPMSAGSMIHSGILGMTISYGMGDGCTPMEGNPRFAIISYSADVTYDDVKAYDIPLCANFRIIERGVPDYWWDGAKVLEVEARSNGSGGGGDYEIPDGSVGWSKLEASVVSAINGVGDRANTAYNRTVELETGLQTILNALDAALAEEVTA